jgi:hypothetical protein
MRKMLFGLGLLLVVSLASCTFATACTEEFRFITLRVEDETSQPVSGVTMSVTFQRTGEVLDMGLEQPDGSYLIADDSLIGKFSSTKDVLTVAGSKADKGFQTQYDIRSDGCHIEKMSGPDVVLLK